MLKISVLATLAISVAVTVGNGAINLRNVTEEEPLI